MRDLILSLITLVRALLKPRRSRHTVIVIVPPSRTDPWVRPWTSPSQDEAREILRLRSTATRTGTPAPPQARRLIVARDGLHFEQPVAVRAARPGPAWTWIR
ncbi:hypothetical protein AB0G74_10850 [Streptomyces sp. NPDC020875]|uniref:hypothetical protein n=1 Tax=Streptomyces sp. NPDC020875 TaxID=3154898 RepID=UPI0033D521CB